MRRSSNVDAGSLHAHFGRQRCLGSKGLGGLCLFLSLDGWCKTRVRRNADAGLSEGGMHVRKARWISHERQKDSTVRRQGCQIPRPQLQHFQICVKWESAGQRREGRCPLHPSIRAGIRHFERKFGCSKAAPAPMRGACALSRCLVISWCASCPLFRAYCLFRPHVSPLSSLPNHQDWHPGSGDCGKSGCRTHLLRIDAGILCLIRLTAALILPPNMPDILLKSAPFCL